MSKIISRLTSPVLLKDGSARHRAFPAPRQWGRLRVRNQPLGGARQKQGDPSTEGACLFIYLFKRKVALPQNKASFRSLATAGQNGALSSAAARRCAQSQRCPQRPGLPARKSLWKGPGAGLLHTLRPSFLNRLSLYAGNTC